MVRETSPPKLTLLLGPAGCGKTYSVIEAFETALRTSPDPLADDLLFILPTAEHRARTIDLILRRGLGGFFQRRVTTFDRAFHEFLLIGGFDFATDVTRRIILREILNSGKFKYFKGLSDQPGFLELVARAIIELKEQLISPEEFDRRLEMLKTRFPEFGLKYDDLAHIYRAYDQELKKRGLVDLRDSLRLLEEGLKRGEWVRPRLREVWIDGFSDFSKLQLSFIEFLARHSDRLTVTLTTDDDPLRKSLFQIVSETQAALEDLGMTKRWVNGRNYRIQNKPLQHLEANLFQTMPVIARESPPRNDGDLAIQIFEATGFLGEVEMIARQIKRLVRKYGYHFSDIALILRQTDPYLNVIRSVFRIFRIPVEIHERIRLRTNPVARTLVSFFRIILEDWSRADLFNFLKSSYVREKDYGLICQMELAALRKGIFRDRAYWLESFKDVPLLQEMARFEDAFRKCESIDQFVRWVKEFMQHFGLLQFPDSADERTQVDREAAKRILLLLEEMKRKDVGGVTAGARLKPGTSSNASIVYAEEFLALVDVDLFSVHSRDKNKVQVYNVSLARQKEYKVVFAAGLLEKRFPIQVKEDPLLSDAERRVINEKGEVLKERLPRQAFERYLFYMAVTRAQEMLILSYPRFDLEGKEALPSFYVEEVRALFGGALPEKKQHVTEVLPSWRDLATEVEAERKVIWDLWVTGGEKVIERDHHLSFALYNSLVAHQAFMGALQKLLTPIEGMIVDERIKPYFAPYEGVWSPTALEEYAECPYRYFSNKLLRLESQTEGIDLRRRGIILHDVLEQFFTWLRDRKKGKVDFEEAKDFCTQKFTELWNEEPLTGDRFYRIELERKRMQEMILQILRTELIEGKPPLQGLTPAYFEFEFRNIMLKGEMREIPLRGKIDRIDVDPERKFALVIDYKTGKQFKADLLKNGTSLQLPFYLVAVRDKLGLEPLGGHLYSLSEAQSSGFHHQGHLALAGIKTRKGIHLSDREFEDLVRRSVRFAEKFVGGIEAAQIPVRPRECVSYCPYSAVCRIEKWRLEHIYRELADEDQEYLGKSRAAVPDTA